jgi:hypothetical protein
LAVDNQRTLAGLARSPYIRRLLPATPVLLITLLMALLAWRVSADENVLFGTEADTIYIADGFYAPEKSAEHGPYRWTEPLAQLRLPNWGPGRIHVIVEGVAGAEGRIALKLGPATLAETHVTPGRPWQLQGWGDTSDRTPPVSLEAPPFNPPGEARDLGVLVKRLEIYAPSARLRAWLDIALLGLAGLLLYAFVRIRTGRTFFSTLAGTSIPALYAPLAAYRDPWMDTVAWATPLALSLALLTVRRRSHRPPSTVHRPSPSTLATLALSAALLLLYLGYMNAFDSDRMYQVAAGIAEYGRPTRYPGLDTWTKYGFGQPLIAVPFYLLGKLFALSGGDPEAITRLTVSFTNLVVTALTLLLLYKAARRFAGVNISLAVAATYLMSTPALNYGRTFFSEPAGALLLIAAILLILPHRQPTTDNRQLTTSPQRALLAGLCLGAMILFKPAFAVYWLPIGIAVLWLSVLSPQSSVLSPLSRVSRFAFRVFSFALGPLLALLVQAWYNYVRYSPLPDAVFRSGYEKEPGFSTPLIEGLVGLFFSPGKSIFLYAPVVLLAPLGLWLMFRRGGSIGKLAALLVIAEVVLSLIFNALWWAWTGNFAWGPRLIMPILPLLLWALAPLAATPKIETASPLTDDSPPPTTDNRQLTTVHRPPSTVHRPPSTVYRLIPPAWLTLAVLGALVNIPGAFVDFQVYYRNYGLLLAGEPGEAITIYDPANSPLLVQTRYLLDGLTAAVYRPSLSSVGMPPVWDVIVPLTLVALSVAALWFATNPAKTPQPQNPKLQVN